MFPESELGAMPSFGNLFGLTVYLDASLVDEKFIGFNGGAHRDLFHSRSPSPNWLRLLPLSLSLRRLFQERLQLRAHALFLVREEWISASHVLGPDDSLLVDKNQDRHCERRVRRHL